jgi:site-specific DNA-methyltransferase (adenine-specific)
MAGMDPESVDSVVTDPPYGLKFMGKAWDHGVPGVEFWEEALRVAKPGAHLLAFGGTRTFHRLACAIEDAGWELRDTIMWVYGSGFPKSHNLDGEWDGWGTALKPAWEPIIVARKPLAGTVASNVLRFGTGALNVDGCRVGCDWDSDPNKRGWQGGNTAQDFDGGSAPLSPSSEPGHQRVSQPNAGGRWPANLVHDGSEEVLAGFPETESGEPAGTRNAPNGYGGGWRQGVPLTGFGDQGSAARFFYCAKATKADRDEGCEGLEKKTNDFNRASSGLNQDRPGREGRTPNTEGSRNHHPTVKPTDLMRWLVRLVTPPGGLVWDPFMGSGSTGKAAMLEGFRFAGADLDPDHVEIAMARIAHAARQGLLPFAA